MNQSLESSGSGKSEQAVLDEIKSKLELFKLEKMDATKEVNEAKEAVTAQQNKKRETELNLDREIAAASKMEKDRVLRECCRELEDELFAVEKEMSDLKIEKDAQLKHFSRESIKKGIVDQSPLGQETQALISELKQEAENTVSPRFVEAYFETLGRCRVAEDDFLDALDNLEEAKNNFYTQRDSKINMRLEWLIDKMSGLSIGTEEEDDKTTGTFIGIGVVACALSIIVFPIYVILCAVTYYLNLKKALLMKKSLDILKVVSDNFSLREKALERKSEIEFRRRQEEIEAEFGVVMSEVNRDIESLKKEISDKRQEVSATFTFDDTKTREDWEKSLETIEHEIVKAKGSETKSQEKLDKVEKKIRETEALYQSTIEKTVSAYIGYDRVGSSKFFPEQFLLSDTGTLTFFKNGRASNFFVYRDMPMALDFIKLICLQVRTRTAPNTVFTQVWDITSSGAGLMSLSNPNREKPSNLFTISNTSAAIKAEIETLSATLQRRLQVILAMGQDINKYNEDMIKLKSVTESYHLIVVLSPEILLTDENVRRLLVNGPSVGIYLYIFADTTKLTDSYFSLIENVGYCANIRNDQLIMAAQHALMDYIKNRKKN